MEQLGVKCLAQGHIGAVTTTGTQLQVIYHTMQVIFGYFITKPLHIVPLRFDA